MAAAKALKKAAAWFPPLHFLGFSLFYVWDYALDKNTAPASGITLASGLPDAAINLSILLIFALLWRQIESPSGRKAAIWTASFAGVLFTLMTCGAIPISPGPATDLIASVFRTAFSLGMFVMWCDLFGMISFSNAVKVISLSFIAAPLVDLAISPLPPTAFFGMALLIPFLAAQCLLRAYATLGAGCDGFSSGLHEPSPSCKGSALSALKSNGAAFALFPWEIILVGVATPFVSNMVKFGNSLGVDVLSFGAAGAVTLLLFLVFQKKFGAFSLINVQFPLLLIGLLAASLFSWLLPDAAQAFIRASGALRLIFILIVVSDRSFRFGLSAIFFASVFRALGVISGQIGAAIRKSTALLQLDPTIHEAMMYFLAIVAVMVVLIIWFRTPFSSMGDAVEKDEATEPDGSRTDTNGGAVAASQGQSRIRALTERCPEDEHVTIDDAELEKKLDAYRQFVAKRCDELSSEYLLSARESEILLLLARGLTVTRIEKELVISNNTVKTHVRHIYRKLGIHSRDELMILVGIE